MERSLGRWNNRLLDLPGENGFIVIFVQWFVYRSLTTDTSLTASNLFTVLQPASIVSVVAIGEMLVLLLGARDSAYAPTRLVRKTLPRRWCCEAEVLRYAMGTQQPARWGLT
jgi:hypothetical protein